MGFFSRKKEPLPKNVEWLVVGLGNPGKKYANNRHNIGWMVATRLAERNKKPVMQLAKNYMQAAMRIDNKLTMAILPTTYMNLSGEAVYDICKMYDIPIDRIIVIVDEYNFPVGKIHIKPGGGDGGHNGISSIIDEMDDNNFYRLRCGIGRDFGQGELVEYVLADFPEKDKEALNVMIDKACDAIECMVKMDPGKSMSEINSGRLWKPKEEKKEIAEEKENDS